MQLTVHAEPSQIWREVHGFEEWEVGFDHDGDGVFSDIEFQFGTDPLDPWSAPMVPHLELRGSEVSLSWAVTPGIELDLFESTDVLEWTALTDPIPVGGDILEILQPIDPGRRFYRLGPSGEPADTDGDCLLDFEELLYFDTDPTLVDTDGDGLSDGDEVKLYRTDPTFASESGRGAIRGRVYQDEDQDPNTTDHPGLANRSVFLSRLSTISAPRPASIWSASRPCISSRRPAACTTWSSSTPKSSRTSTSVSSASTARPPFSSLPRPSPRAKATPSIWKSSSPTMWASPMSP